MKGPYSEGVASHTGPESCVDSRMDFGEALKGEVRAGQGYWAVNDIVNFGMHPHKGIRKKTTPEGEASIDTERPGKGRRISVKAFL